MMMVRRLLPLMLVLVPVTAHAYGPSFHAAFDGTLEAKPGGETAQTHGDIRFAEGRTGQAALFSDGAYATYAARDVLSKERGTLSMWISPRWDGDDGRNHAFFADVSDYNNTLDNTLCLWKTQAGFLRLDLRSPQDRFIAADVRHWRAGQWYHVAATWDVASGMVLYIDGNIAGFAPAEYTPNAWPLFNVGADWAGGSGADALIADLRIYDRALDARPVADIMADRLLEEATVTTILAPPTVQVGQPFHVQVRAVALQPLTRQYPVVFTLNGMELAAVMPGPETTQWPEAQFMDIYPIELTIPAYMRLLPGEYTLSARIGGAVQPAKLPPASVQLTVRATPPAHAGHGFRVTADGVILRSGRPFIPEGPGEGFLYQGRFYTNDDEGRALARELVEAGLAQDAWPVRLVDEVDCSEESHDFRQWGESLLRELLPGTVFRLTGPPESVKETVAGSDPPRPVLPGFAYVLKNLPAPAPHVLVAELPNDRDRCTEIAVDAAPGSTAAAHVQPGGPGTTVLADLSVLYTGHEVPAGDDLIRHTVVFYPKSDACRVTVTASGRETQPAADSGAAVSRLRIFAMLDSGPGLHNVIDLPRAQPRRSVSLHVPAPQHLFTQFGFSGQNLQQRRASLHTLFDYMKFVGADRLDFNPLAFGMQAYYSGSRLPNALDYDIFDEIVPLAAQAGIAVVPALEGLAYYDDFPHFGNESFLVDHTGDLRRSPLGKRVPNPLRPEVQAVLMGFLSEFLEKARLHGNMPLVSFAADGLYGTCFTGEAPDGAPMTAGYSEWDIRAFESATGLTVGGTAGDPASRYAWLREQPETWERWLQWRCEATRDLWLKCRDLVASRAPGTVLLVRTNLPGGAPTGAPEADEALASLDMLRGFGVDPRLYARDRGIRLSRPVPIGAERYFGPAKATAMHHDIASDEAFRTAEGAEVELKFTWWELADHPLGFRVGAAAPAGRAYFKPLTHALRTADPYTIAFHNWHRATMGREFELRRFIRAYRALPAVPPEAFEGEVWPKDPHLVVRRHGNRIAVINDSPRPRQVRLNFPQVLSVGAPVVELGTGRALPKMVGRTVTRVIFDMEPYDLATLEVRERPEERQR